MKKLLALLILGTSLQVQAMPPPPWVPSCYGDENVEQTEPLLLTLYGISGFQEQQVIELILNDDVLDVSSHLRLRGTVTLTLSVDESALPQDVDANEIIRKKLTKILEIADITDGQWEAKCNKLPDTPRGGGSNGTQP